MQNVHDVIIAYIVLWRDLYKISYTIIRDLDQSMVGSGLLNTVVLTLNTLIETVDGDRDDYEWLSYGVVYLLYDLYECMVHWTRCLLGFVNDVV